MKKIKEYVTKSGVFKKEELDDLKSFCIFAESNK